MTTIGHDQVLTFFDDALSEMARCRFVEVVGEPGTGRTRLLREMCRLAHRRGVPAWYARADGADRPFGVVADAADDHFVPATLDRLTLLDAVRCAQVLPSVATLLGLDDDRDGADRHTVRHALRALLIAHASMSGLVLALDDLHAADASSVALVASLLRNPPPAPMLVVTASRPGQLLSVAFDSAVRDGTACRVALASDHVPYLETARQVHAGDAEVAAMLVAAARRVRDHLPNTAAQCLRVALRLLPPEALQDRLELQIEFAATGLSKESVLPA